MKEELEIFIDGASSGNPGEAAVGIVINENHKRIKEISQTIGHATNNVAEYSALIRALEEALKLEAKALKIFTDSALLFSQVTGRYKVKNEQLKVLFDQAQELAKKFDDVKIDHIPREKNHEADRLATQALKKQAKMVTSTSIGFKPMTRSTPPPI